jgi:hypothetical protein
MAERESGERTASFKLSRGGQMIWICGRVGAGGQIGREYGSLESFFRVEFRWSGRWKTCPRAGKINAEPTIGVRDSFPASH